MSWSPERRPRSRTALKKFTPWHHQRFQTPGASAPGAFVRAGAGKCQNKAETLAFSRCVHYNRKADSHAVFSAVGAIKHRPRFWNGF